MSAVFYNTHKRKLYPWSFWERLADFPHKTFPLIHFFTNLLARMIATSSNDSISIRRIHCFLDFILVFMEKCEILIRFYYFILSISFWRKINCWWILKNIKSTCKNFATYLFQDKLFGSHYSDWIPLGNFYSNFHNALRLAGQL